MGTKLNNTDRIGLLESDVTKMREEAESHQGINKKDQLRAAGLCMEWAALAWYRWVEAQSSCHTWEKLKKKLLVRFQPSYEGNVYQQFLSVQQVGTARDYVCEFEKLAG
ncbi:unnamed protein product [Lactuca virosa]|uniref:Retrotransposon gag domain-containing protein n=1 Tax=Lactuca virosa TaxID=75947 RepID=A0AAU9LHV1_9ASTR|nr:unnamed protein product [Lactuca virosa]